MPLENYIELKKKSPFETLFLESSEYTDFDKRNYFQKSLFSVITDTAEVEVFIIEPSTMTFIAETTQSMIFKEMMKIEEPDRPSCILDIQKKLDERKQWNGYKNEMIKKTLKHQFLTKN